MDIISYFLISLLLFFVAMLCSNIGSGGGLLYVPIMLTLTPYSKESIVMLSLLLTLVTVLPSLLNHCKAGYIERRLIIVLTITTIVGEVIGCFINIAISKTVFTISFTVLLLFVLTKIILDVLQGKKDIDKDDKVLFTPGRKTIAAGISIASGISSSLYGISGGILNVPVMRYLLGRNFRACVGTSFLIIALTNPIGIATYVYLGVPIPSGLDVLICLGTPIVLLGSYFGSKWGLKYLKTSTVLVLFMLLLISATVKMLIDIVLL